MGSLFLNIYFTNVVIFVYFAIFFQVHAKEVNKFQLAYAGVLKANMDNLKKRERKTGMETKMKSANSSKNAVKI